MSFNFNNINAVPPSGALMATLLSSDPDGWVIADGTERTTSSIYNNLVTLSIGSRNGSNNYVPPNLKGAFLRGTDVVTYDSVTYTGQAKMEFQDHSIEQHKHTATQAAHNHTTNAQTNSGATAGLLGLGMCNGVNTESSRVNGDDDGQLNSMHVFDFNITNSTPAITVNSIGDTDTAPYCYGINWAIKL
jgi:microcystin-dependent protein